MTRPAPGTVGVFAALAFLYLYPLFYFPINNPNERVRIYMTAAMVDQGTFVIGRREARPRGRGFKDTGSVYDRWGYVNDKALVCDDPELEPPDCEGPLYSAKAPGTSFLAVPAYALYSLAGDTEDYRSVTLFLRLALLVVPGLLFLWGFRRYAARWVRDPWILDTGTLGLGLGSMFFTYSHMVAGHQLTALLLFTGFALTEAGSRGDAARRRHLLLVLGGMATAMSVVVEYPSIVGAAAVGVMVMMRAARRGRLRLLASFVAGCLPPAVLMGWFHASAFGAPWSTAYTTLENPQFVKDIAYGFMGIRAPTLENLEGSFLAPYNGMFYFAPWLGLVIPAAVAAPWPGRRRDGAPAGTAAAVAVMFTLFISCHSLWRGGWTLGPRYIVAFVPFAALLIILALDGLEGPARTAGRYIFAGLVLASVAVTGACTLVTQGFPTSFHNPLREAVLPLLSEGYATRTLGHAAGLSGVWAWLPLGAALLWPVWRIGAGVADGPGSPRVLRPLTVLGCLGLAGLVFWVLLLPAEPPTIERVGSLGWMKDHYEEDGGYPEAREDLFDLRAFTRAFPGDGPLAALAVTEETRSGKWMPAKKLARRWTDGRWKRLQRRGQAGAVLGALSMASVPWAFPLWDPEDMSTSTWTSPLRSRVTVLPPDRGDVPAESGRARATERGIPEAVLELPRIQPFELLRREAQKLMIRSQLPDLRLPRPPGLAPGVVGTDQLTDVAAEEGPGALHGGPDPSGERAPVLDGPVREAAPSVEDALSPERGRRTGGLAPPALPAVSDRSGGVQPDQVSVDREPAQEDPGAVDRVDEAAAPADPPEARVDSDGLLHDRRAVHEDPPPEADPGAENPADRVESAP